MLSRSAVVRSWVSVCSDSVRVTSQDVISVVPSRSSTMKVDPGAMDGLALPDLDPDADPDGVEDAVLDGEVEADSDPLLLPDADPDCDPLGE